MINPNVKAMRRFLLRCFRENREARVPPHKREELIEAYSHYVWLKNKPFRGNPPYVS